MTDAADRVLILAPVGRDGPASGELLSKAGLSIHICSALSDVLSALPEGAAAVFVAEEALFGRDLADLERWVVDQPPWSDLPFVVLTSHRQDSRVTAWRQRLVVNLGNVSLLERPVHPITLSSTLQAAVRARRRQYEVRALLQARESAAGELQDRVEEATAELRQQMVERAHVEEQLRHMQKIESIGELTGGVAHDFNNLLTAVIGNLELLKKRIPYDLSVDRLIDGAMAGAQRGASLTQRLLAFARQQPLEPRAVDLADLVRGMANLLNRSVGPTIKTTLDLPEKLPAVHIDANQIELALLNLAVNARDAMPDGGEVTISLRRCITERTADLAAGDYVCLRVSDTGAGMDGDTLKRAIEPFFSTKGIGKGTGLGLSMVHGVALQLKGALRLESTPGRGTTAELWLPISTERVVDAPADVHTPRDLKGATLLLVDDDFLINLSTKALLEDLGHTVIEASSGAGALEVLRSGKPIDLMITDYAMPGMSGVQLAVAARRLRPDLPVLLATGYAELPMDSVPDLPRLSKPYHQRQLAEQITALVARPNAI